MILPESTCVLVFMLAHVTLVLVFDTIKVALSSLQARKLLEGY